MDGVTILGIPPSTAKRAIVKGTNDSKYFVEKRGKKAKQIIKITSKKSLLDLSR